MVGDTEDVSPHFFKPVDIIRHVPPLFPLWVLYLRGFKNKSVICHVLCEEVFMLAGRPHIAKFMLKQSLVCITDSC